MRSRLARGVRDCAIAATVLAGVSLVCGVPACAAVPEASVQLELSKEYSSLVCDDFEDGLLDPGIWSLIGGDRSVLVEERAGELSCAGRTSEVGKQSGVDTAFAFETGSGFEVALQLRASEDLGGGFAVELLSTTTYYHVTLMCAETYFGLWYCYFGSEAPTGCHEASRSPLILDDTAAGRVHSVRLQYDGVSRQMVATVGGRPVGILALPLPIGEVILRLFVQSPLQASETGGGVGYSLAAVSIGWGAR